MPVDSWPGLVDIVRRLELLPPARLAELTDSLQAAFPTPRALAAELVNHGWLTPYQVNQIFLDRAAGLVLGPYVVLERLGEGGMGQVFKARNRKLGRIVALKLIRKDRLANPDAVRRFHREIQAAAQLEHPNIVRAYDADEAGGAHLSSWSTSRGPTWPAWSSKHGPLPIAAPATMPGRRRWGCSTPTSAAWSIATSSRPTCCWRRKATWSRFWTWAWPAWTAGDGRRAPAAP